MRQFSYSGWLKGDALLTLLFNFALGFVITKVQGDQMVLTLIGTRQLMF